MTAFAALTLLVAAGVLSAAAVLRAFARFSDRAKVLAAKRQIKASLYEIRLFTDEPAVLLRAQGRLVTANLRYLSLMLRPLLIVAAPMFLLMTALDAVYGHRPITPGEAVLVTMYVQPSVDLNATTPVMESTPGIAVETTAVHIPGEQRVFWRIRPTQAASGRLTILLGGAAYEKSIRAGAGFTVVSTHRVRSVFAWLLHPTESRLPAGAIDRIEVAYPEAALTLFGASLPWLVWFVLASLAAAIWMR